MGMAACTLIGAMTIGGTMAYLTDHEETENVFTIGKVQVDLTEPDWPGNESDEVPSLIPNQEIPKNPQITNTGDTDAIVFMIMETPVIPKNRIVSYDGTPLDLPSEVNAASTVVSVEGTSLFWFKDENDPETPPDLGAEREDITDGIDESDQYQHFSDQWVDLTKKLIESLPDSEISLMGVVDPTIDLDTTFPRIFAYKTSLKPGETTDALFDKIQLKNVVEFTERDRKRAALAGANNINAEGSIGITACAIQADKVYGDTADLTTDLTDENLIEIFKTFMIQREYSGVEGRKNANNFNALDLQGKPLN